MTRRVNTEAKREISCAAYRLFLKNGYNATSMADIAEECGITKSLVQKHFKKKDVFIHGFLEDLLNYTDEYLESKHKRSDNYWINLQLLGQLHYAYLLRNDGKCKLMLDIVSSRQLTDTMIRLDIEWAFSYMHSFSEDQQEEVFENMSLVMGGAYQIIYQSLVDNRQLDFEAFQRKLMSLTMFLQGFSKEEAMGLLTSTYLSPEDYEDAIAFLDSKFLGD